jgi:hypothetical protein
VRPGRVSRFPVSGFQATGSRICRVSGFKFQASGSRFRVSGFGFQVSGPKFRVSGFGFRVVRARNLLAGLLREHPLNDKLNDDLNHHPPPLQVYRQPAGARNLHGPSPLDGQARLGTPLDGQARLGTDTWTRRGTNLTIDGCTTRSNPVFCTVRRVQLPPPSTFRVGGRVTGRWATFRVFGRVSGIWASFGYLGLRFG